MNVELLAHTTVTDEALDLLEQQWGVGDADHLVELAGRDCYQSFDRPNPETAHTHDYVGKNLIGKKHFSVLEHATATLRFTGISRSLTHELVRHRHFSYSQLSQRYVDITASKMIVPPAIRDWPDEREREAMLGILREVWERSIAAYGQLEDILMGPSVVEGGTGMWGLPKKRAREAARSVLPNMTETAIVVTGNHRAWREFLEKRNSPYADAEICEAARAALVVLSKVAPACYQDMLPRNMFGATR